MSKERKNPAVLGLDMGGTHTDAVLLRGGTLLASVKVPTNHQDLLVSTGAQASCTTAFTARVVPNVARLTSAGNAAPDSNSACRASRVETSTS